MPPRESFNNVCRNRVRRLPYLATELEPLERWTLFERQLMKLDEEIISALPRNERFMSKRHD
jgi:hypothetical protein